MKIVPLTAEAVLAMGELEAIHSGYTLTPAIAVDLESVGGYAVWDGERVIALGGILPRWPNCGMAWAWLSRDWRRHARAITDIVRVNLDVSEYDRIEAGVRVDYTRGQAWMARLGFEIETPLARKWGPDGADYSIYVRLR
jgi:hypothetical protein